MAVQAAPAIGPVRAASRAPQVAKKRSSSGHPRSGGLSSGG